MFVGGVDEVGRGCLAGPVVAACVVFPQGAELPQVRDSKQLSALRRAELAEEIKSVPGVQWALGEVDAEGVDRLNILRATFLAMERAVAGIKRVDFVLVDGNRLPQWNYASRAVVKGDSLSASIAAASILAKTARDAAMEAFDAQYPGYGFAGHKGYGTAEHLAALSRLGASPIHRQSFAPVRELGAPAQMDLFKED